MKKTQKALALLLATLSVGASMASLSSCGGTGDDGTITKLYIGNYNGGFGDEWLKKAEARFETKYANTSFEEGKIGVDVVIENTRNAGTSFLQTLEKEASDIFFTEGACYYDAANTGKFLEITDIVKGDLSEYGESGNIYEKLTKTQQDYYSINEKIYALPHYSNHFVITYDVDMFEENGYYRTKDGKFVGELANPEAAELSYGVNGKTGVINGVDYSVDDGLPATYKELFELCEYMKSDVDGCFLWAGANKHDYVSSLLAAMYVDYEGLENTMLNANFSGTAKDLVKLDTLTQDKYGAITNMEFEPALSINNSNGYKLYQQAGRIYALSFLEQIMRNGYTDDKCVGGDDHLTAQYDYLKRSLNGKVAFFIDGNYWENEAEITGKFDLVVGEKGAQAKRENRRFAFMPMPKATNAQVGEKTTLLDKSNSLAFITASIDSSKIKCAKAFLQFCYTDESLIEFSLTTNTPKSLNYTIPTEDFDKLSSFGKTLFNLRNNSALCNVVYPFDENEMFLNNEPSLKVAEKWTAKGYAPCNAFIQGRTAVEHFKFCAEENNQGIWNNSFSKYF